MSDRNNENTEQNERYLRGLFSYEVNFNMWDPNEGVGIFQDHNW